MTIMELSSRKAVAGRSRLEARAEEACSGHSSGDLTMNPSDRYLLHHHFPSHLCRTQLSVWK